ncbi:pilus assembly protein [Alkanindiges hydrocarboniclasticus]
MENENKLFPMMRLQRVKLAASFAWAFTGTLLIASSVVQASDMQIYAVPTAGKKTIVMMLDTSGSMNYISADYDVGGNSTSATGTSVTANGSGTRVQILDALTGLSDNTTYKVTGTNLPYMLRFTYVNKSSVADVPAKVKNTTSGCEKVGTTGRIYRCYDRITRLKDGLFAFLDSDNSTLVNARVGLGHYSVDGDGNAGKILVPASALGAIGSTQRNALKTAAMGLVAIGGTPTAAAYTEAAAYLMGTSTVGSSTVSIPMYIRYYPTISTQTYFYRRTGNQSNRRFYQCRADGAGVTSTSACTSTTEITDNNTINNITNMDNDGGNNPRYYYRNVDTTSTTLNYRSCTAYDTSGCTSWSSASTTNPTTSAYTACTVSGASGGGCVYEDKTILGTNSYSGFKDSVSTSKKTDLLSYSSPLPAAADRVSCDGQGVYILSDGVPTEKDDSTLNSVMNASLNSTTFSCSASGALTSDSDWHCMSNYAKKLFNGGEIQSVAANATNPMNVPIQTAFVGFGGDFSDLAGDDVKNACKLTSRTQSDRTSDDACSPNQGTNAVANPGYGNGGFFTAQTAAGVTDSVIAFINNLGVAPLEPLTTGAISVPVDPLTSNGFQPYGYLRALEPNPANAKLIWLGNLKKYQVLLDGTNAGAFGDKNKSLIYNSKGAFVQSTKDMWNTSAYDDGGITQLGGVYSKVPMPVLGQTQDLTTKPPKYTVLSNPDAIRSLFTDVASTDGATLGAMSNNNSLLRIPEGPVPTTGVGAYILSKLNAATGQTTLKDFPLLAKQKILNYLGYSVPLDSTATALPSSLVTPDAPHLAMGGSVHSFPVQLTYSGTLDANGDLTATRDQSVLYGSMEGGLHIVNGDTGVEQMVFVPSEILRNEVASKALVKGEEDLLSPTAGVDGAWVADPAYKVSSTGNSITARQMNVYGGLRMGGNSYYGLDVLDPSSPKLLFRAGSDQSDFSRMGQSWSKPVLANIRYNGAIKRVMIVGGGYDTCYESPTFTLAASGSGTTCATTSAAKGNAVYIIDAKTGARLWWASDSGADSNNANMKHSVVSRISALDRNADGLIDHLYFGDLGGQVFRADLNNNQTKTGSSYSSFGVRVARLANLATTDAGAALTDGKNPRFYEAPTVTIHDQAGKTFIVVGIASGNRSTPLDVFPIIGRDGMSPAVALNDRLVNNVYGIIDRDFINKDLMTIADTSLITRDKTLSTFQKDPQTIASGSVISTFFPSSGTGKDGWYRSLSSKSDGTERADNSFRIKGGMKAFEEPIALTGNLIVPVYDPQGTGITPSNSCLPRVVGETDRQLYCLPFGVCLNTNGTTNTTAELKTGFLTTIDTAKCPVGVTECNDNTLGSGIRGVALVPKKDTSGSPDSCGRLTLAGNESGVGEWQCTRKLNPTRWYEKYTSS